MSKKSSSPFSPWSGSGSDSGSSDGTSALTSAAADLSAAAAQLQEFAAQLAAGTGAANSVNVNVTVTDGQGGALPSSMELDGPDFSLLS